MQCCSQLLGLQSSGSSPQRIEHLSASQARKRFGTTIEVVPETHDGDIDVAELERMIESGPKPKLVAVSHIATNSGLQLTCRL
jgi:selenocysteine lyase/cysteine desulfurase